MIVIAFVCTVATFGCTPKAERSDPWFSQGLTLEETSAITVVIDGGFIQDGGTIELYAVTESGRRCSIRLNQHAFHEGDRFNGADTPGRLYFNDLLIGVRSADEQKVLDLLKEAEFIAVGIEGMRQLVDLEIIETALLKSLVSDSAGSDMLYFRDSIVDYVESDRYVDIAKNGIPIRSETGG